jgi:hypothetical protein
MNTTAAKISDYLLNAAFAGQGLGEQYGFHGRNQPDVCSLRLFFYRKNRDQKPFLKLFLPTVSTDFVWNFR